MSLLSLNTRAFNKFYYADKDINKKILPYGKFLYIVALREGIREILLK